ncbi:MAG: protein kinase [Gemmataceae bacterium]
MTRPNVPVGYVAINSSAPSLDDPRVMQAVEEYADRLQAGDRPDRAAFLVRHADIADALARCLDGLELVHAAGRDLSGSAGEMAGDALLDGSPLGDFRLIRELGRGGMGIVYEAEQLSLGRSVALKVLPYAATMDARQLQRFKNEARAAASLHHENIVPVHGVGCDRGVHFYAMQLIDGRSLAAVIDDLRPSDAAGGACQRPGFSALESDAPNWGVDMPCSPTAPVAALSEEQRAGPCALPSVGRIDRPGSGRLGVRPFDGHRPPRHQACEPDTRR